MPTLDFGGVESRIVLQTNLFDRDAFDLKVCAFWEDGRAAAKVRAAGVPVDILGQDPSVRNPGATAALTAYLRKVRPDILHASISEANFHGGLAGALTGVPYRIIEEVGIPSRGRLGRSAFRVIYALSHRIIGVSQATCNTLRDEGAPPSKVETLYNCAHPSFFEDRSLVRPPRPTVDFLAVGRLVPVKNHLNLIDAFRGVVDRAPHARLRIAGEGPLRAELQALIQRLQLERYVSLLGFRADVRELLETSDVFLLPSWSEGCSISLIEAMSTGSVVLGSTADGITEVMSDLGPDYQIPAADVRGWTHAMTRCANMSAEARANVGSIARTIAFTRFSPTAYMNNLGAMYRTLAASQRHPTSPA